MLCCCGKPIGRCAWALWKAVRSLCLAVLAAPAMAKDCLASRYDRLADDGNHRHGNGFGNGYGNGNGNGYDDDGAGSVRSTAASSVLGGGRKAGPANLKKGSRTSRAARANCPAGDVALQEVRAQTG